MSIDTMFLLSLIFLLSVFYGHLNAPWPRKPYSQSWKNGYHTFDISQIEYGKIRQKTIDFPLQLIPLKDHLATDSIEIDCLSRKGFGN